MYKFHTSYFIVCKIYKLLYFCIFIFLYIYIFNYLFILHSSLLVEILSYSWGPNNLTNLVKSIGLAPQRARNKELCISLSLSLFGSQAWVPGFSRILPPHAYFALTTNTRVTNSCSFGRGWISMIGDLVVVIPIEFVLVESVLLEIW